MRILLIEDDIDLCNSLTFQFKNEGFSIDICNDGDAGLDAILENCHDLIILDRMLPKLDGLSILKKARMENISTPIILLTALGQVDDKVDGLDCGADDYIVKPFEFKELLARIRCICRRPVKINIDEKLYYGDISFDEHQRLLFKDDLSCSLSKKETFLLQLFLKNPNQILTRDILLTRVWGNGADIEDGNLDNYIYFLRRRLSSLNSTVTIKTIRGLGYRLEVQDV